jgi:hypothetical protein
MSVGPSARARSAMGVCESGRRERLERLKQLILQPIEMSVVNRVLREFVPAKAFGSIQKSFEDWDLRGRPREERKDFCMYLIVSSVEDFERVRAARIQYRRTYFEEAGERDETEAAKVGWKLRVDECRLDHARTPDPPIERGGGDLSPAVEELTSSPARLVAELESTAAGCRWLCQRWGEIRGSLDIGRRWYVRDAFTMIRLMGRTPRDVLELSEVAEVFLASHALDRRARNPFAVLEGALSLAEARDLVRGLGPRVKPSREEGDAEQARQTLLAMVERAIAHLLAKTKEHEDRAKSDEGRMAAEREFDTSPQAVGLKRYEQACQRSLKESVSSFRKCWF